MGEVLPVGGQLRRGSVCSIWEPPPPPFLNHYVIRLVSCSLPTRLSAGSKISGEAECGLDEPEYTLLLLLRTHPLSADCGFKQRPEIVSNSSAGCRSGEAESEEEIPSAFMAAGALPSPHRSPPSHCSLNHRCGRDQVNEFHLNAASHTQTQAYFRERRNL